MLTRVRVKGQSPLLIHKFTDGDAQAISAGTSSSARGREKPLPREQATERLYTDSQGRSVIPGPNVFRAIIDAGRFTKSGRSQITSAKSSLVPAAIVLTDLECLIEDEHGKPCVTWEVDSRSVVNPSTQGRVMCHRPRFDAWFLSFTMIVDGAMFSDKLVRQLVDDAGSKVGLGAFRPARKGPFGRFKVVSWETSLEITSAVEEGGLVATS